MNRFARCLPLLLVSFLLTVVESQGQVNFLLTEVNVLPTNPDNETIISVELIGTKSDPCSYLASSDLLFNGNFLTLTMDWENSANNPPFTPCPSNFSEPWDTTITVGLLDIGTYFLFLDGTNYIVASADGPIPFNVGEANCVEPDGSILVTNTADNGSGSLRQAIQCANETPGANTILFDLAGPGPHTINVGETTQLPLPTLTDDATIIDGSSHPNFGNGDFSPKVILNGAFNTWDSPINALWIQGDDCEVYSLAIINFPDDAIDITQANGVQIGAADRGNVIHSNGSPVDFFPGAPGTGPWNGCGIVIRGNAGNCTVQGNFIGTNYDQSLSPGNEYCGILIRDGGDSNTIGGTADGLGNVIAENATGIRINNGSLFNSIRQNSFHCNDTAAIDLFGNANLSLAAPQVTVATSQTISGTADPSQTIEIYLSDNSACLNSPCQGSILMGTATVQNGTWNLLPPFANGIVLTGGEKITALASDFSGNTSEFANCLVVVGVSDCTDDQGIVWVTNNSDEGDGSLRAAIDCVNNTPGSNKIHFNISGVGPHTIQVGTTSGEALPALLDESTILDASTQTGFGDNGDYSPQIILDGQIPDWTVPINALWVRGNFCEVYALAIINFPDDGIDITQADFVTIGGINKGNVIYNNGSPQDFFSGTPGTGPWNGCGIVIKQGSDYASILGNIIGTNYQADLVAGNEDCGILIRSGGDHHVIGGTQLGESNTIANHHTGIRILANSTSCLISNNAIFCNDSLGIHLLDNANNNQLPPTIDTVDVNLIAGQTALTDLYVDVYINDNDGCSDAPCQGKTFLGQANVTNGSWSLNAPFANGITLLGGTSITATATDGNNNTSAYAVCQSLQLCTLTADISNETDATCGLTNGSFEVVAENGTVPYDYDLGNGPQANATFNGLAGGTYSVTVTDGNSCSAVVEAIIGESDGPTLAFDNITDASCAMANGSVNASATGGTAPYTFLLVGSAIDGPPFNNLVGGSYTIIVTDANSCTDSGSFTIGSSPAPTLSIANTVDASCNQANGSVTLMPDAGTPPYLYYLDGQSSSNPTFSNLNSGTYSVSVVDANTCVATESVTIGDTPVPTLSVVNTSAATCDQADGGFTLSSTNGTAPYLYHFQQISTSNPVFTGLAGGTYMVSVEDANGCIDETTVTIGNTPAPVIAVSNVSTASCGENNGSITVSAALGTAPYLYDLGNGLTNNPVFNNLPGGIYQVSVVDANMCTASLTAIIGDTPAPVLELLTTTNPTCGQSNGSATYLGSGGTAPYTYSIGSATFPTPIFTGVAAGIYQVVMTDLLGCTAVESFELFDPGMPQLSIIELSNATCNLNNGSAIIGVFDGLLPYTFDIGNGPMSNSEFNNLATGDYVVTVTDNVGCTNTIDVVIDNIGEPANAAFTFQDDEGIVDFMNNSVNGLSYFWDFGDGTTSMAENPSHEYQLDGDYTVCLTTTNACGDDLSCSLVTILLPLAEVSISGTLTMINGAPIGNAIVNCTDETPITTGADGFYEFLSLPAAEDFTVTPTKDINYLNGVNIFDIYLIQQHILAVIPFDSPHKIIAADVNHNEIVNLLDVLIMQELILNIIDTFPDNTSWRFVPSSYTFPNLTAPFTPAFPESLSFANLLGDSIDQDFVGIKIGDVSVTADPLLGSSRTIDLQMEHQIASVGEIIEIEVTAKDFYDLAALQMNLAFASDHLEWKGIETGQLTGLTADHFALSTDGNLRMIWHDQTIAPSGISIDESAVLYTLLFEAKTNIDQLSDYLQLGQTTDFQTIAFEPNGKEVNVQLTFKDVLSPVSTPVEDLKVAVFPNPFANKTQVHVELAGTEKVQLRVYDALGRLVKQAVQPIQTHGTFDIHANELDGAGLYFWELVIGTKTQRGKLLFGIK